MGTYTDEYTESLEAEVERLRAALLQVKHGAEYSDELGDIIDAALGVYEQIMPQQGRTISDEIADCSQGRGNEQTARNMRGIDPTTFPVNEADT